MKIFIIRHGETNKNITQTVHHKGDLEDLNELGIAQISKAAKSLINSRITTIYSSNELRAKHSAQILTDTLQCKQTPIQGFEERDWGLYSDKPWPEIKAILDPLTIDERFNFTPPNGESWKQFEQRLADALNEVIHQSSEESIVIVTHAGAIRALIPYLLHIPREESFKYDPSNASITEFEYDGRTFTNIRVNDVSHLEG